MIQAFINITGISSNKEHTFDNLRILAEKTGILLKKVELGAKNNILFKIPPPPIPRTKFSVAQYNPGNQFFAD